MSRRRIKSIDSILAARNRQPLPRSLNALHLTLFGVGTVIGTGIFVLIAEASQKAGPAVLISFVIAGAVCAVAALCYAELAAMLPVAGSAYTYTYATLGEIWAWTVGWALILEYTVSASAVAAGWSGYFTGTVLHSTLSFDLPRWLSAGPQVPGGFVDLPAVVIALLMTLLLVTGITASARVNAVLIGVKVCALGTFIALTLPVASADNLEPFLPTGIFHMGGLGVMGAAATVFFAYTGFDAVSTAAEETVNPQRNVPLGLLLSLAICTAFYVLVAIGAIGTIGGQPLLDASGIPLRTGSAEIASRCAEFVALQAPLVCSNEALAHVLRRLGHGTLGNWMGYAAFLALPSVILMNLYGQSRIFFVMSRDGLLPASLSRVHPRWRTPHVVTAFTGVSAAITAGFFPVGTLADYANAGTLYAFLMVAVAAWRLRRTNPERHRPFRVPALGLVTSATVCGCLYLYISLPIGAQLLLPAWGAVGLTLYFAYGFRYSALRGETR